MEARPTSAGESYLMRQPLLNALHFGKDPFNDVTSDWLDHADPIDEWDSKHIWFAEAVSKHKPSTVIEVGSFLGGSARNWARMLQSQANGGQVICVDTWLAERTLWQSPLWRTKMRFEAGRPMFYRTFMANAVVNNLQGHIIPLSMDSRNGARYLRARNVTAPVIYIDAGHDYEDCLTDIRLYWQLLEPGGVMIIDDYEHLEWAGVKEAVHLHAAQVGVKVETSGIKARMRRAIE